MKQKMTEEKKKTITQEKHPGHVAQGHKFVALNKKRKEEIFRSKEQSTVQPTEQSTVQSTVQPTAQPIVQSTVQYTVQSNDTYVYGFGILAVLAIGVCVFFAYNTFQPKNKKLVNENRINHQNDVICF